MIASSALVACRFWLMYYIIPPLLPSDGRSMCTAITRRKKRHWHMVNRVFSSIPNMHAFNSSDRTVSTRSSTFCLTAAYNRVDVDHEICEKESGVREESSRMIVLLQRFAGAKVLSRYRARLFCKGLTMLYEFRKFSL
jgi:hypothetical protein